MVLQLKNIILYLLALLLVAAPILLHADNTPQTDQQSQLVNDVSERIQQAQISGVIKLMPGENILTLAKLFFRQQPGAEQIFIEDVIRLNPQVFDNRRINNTPVGTVLKLPDYIWQKTATDEPQPADTAQTSTEATPEIYLDQYITESDLTTIESARQEEAQLLGRRSLAVEYRYYSDQDDFLGDETEQGLYVNYRRETLHYGELDVELSLSDFSQSSSNFSNREGSGGLVTLRQIDMPLFGNWLLSNTLGHQRSFAGSLLHGGFRFRLPTSLLLGYSTDLSDSIRKIQAFAGATGSYEGVASQQFEEDGGTLTGASYQQQLTYSLALGGQLVTLQGHDEVVDHSSVLLAGKYVSPDNTQAYELRFLADDNANFGVWNDNRRQLSSSMNLRYGAFYIAPDLLWTDVDIANDQLGLYLRFDKQSFRNSFSTGYDFFETGIDNNAPASSENHTVHFNSSYRASRRLTLGIASNYSQRKFTSTSAVNDQQNSWQVNGFLFYRFAFGTSRFELFTNDLDSETSTNSRESNRLRLSHDWNTPQAYRVTTQFSVENENSVRDELQLYTVSLLYQQDILGNLSWGTNLSLTRSDSEQLGGQSSANVNINTRWQITPRWHINMSANFNQAMVNSNNFFNPFDDVQPNTLDDVQSNTLWLTLGYGKTAGQRYPIFGQGNASSGTGTIRGVVFYDENRDGIQQAGEELVQGEVLLLDGRHEVRTNNQGRFEFWPVATGRHHVRLALENLPLPWGLADDSPRQVEVGLRKTTEINFPLIRLDQ
ncbi:MAG: hypothetical protein JKY90_01080 [Gammaproteobacteria bacterium]|nr:hypothetical protein [Gammaproteobacteria bacterium]